MSIKLIVAVCAAFGLSLFVFLWSAYDDIEKQSKQNVNLQNADNLATTEKKNDEILLSDFSYTISKECTQNSESAEIQILYTSKIMQTIETNYCLIDRVDFLALVDHKILFSVLPSGIGGFYIYPMSFNVYLLDMKNSTIELISNRIVGTVGFDVQRKQLAFVRYEESLPHLFIVDLTDRQIKNFPLSIQHTGQIGKVLFSPDGIKIAIEVGYGPEDIRGEIYIFDTLTSRLTRIVTEKYHLQITGWKNNNEVNWSELSN